MNTPEKSSLSCTYCGLPVFARHVEAGRPVYCCSGCLFADSLSQSLRQERLSLWMIFAMVTLFLVFNQMLFLLLGSKYYEEGIAAGSVLLVISLLAGVGAWGGSAGMVIRQSRQGMAPRPWFFIGISLAFVGGILYGLLSPERLPLIARVGIVVSLLVVVLCFLQRWLLRPFRRGSK